MRGFIKFLLLTGLVAFAFFNYHLISFNNGLKIFDIEEENNDIVNNIKTVLEVQAIYYYENPFFGDGYQIVIESKDRIILQKATKEEIDILKVTSIVLGSRYSPQKVTAIPIWVFMLLFLIILIIPFGKKNRT